MLLPTEVLEYFEKAIYYPLLLVVLGRDKAAIEVGDFKFKGPYLNMIERAEDLVSEDFKQVNIYFRKHNMKLNKLGNDGVFTEYEFFYGGYSDKRRYLNMRLRNRTGELLGEFLMKGPIQIARK